MSTLNELQQRLAVATDRNRANNERRTKTLAEIDEKFGCKTVGELRAKIDNHKAELETLRSKEAEAHRKAEEAVSAVENAVA